ncbi:hypothetical protein GTY65_30635 [Streptomyces sp. SID8379]|uniref:hypothetical protein n=1 Tax=Streptomyces sp. SID8379 TaxID=2690359 RepID=UPI000D0AADD8|nr:hypothetical protein [Streptomyces sp. HmicA12]MYW68399.1 hypothetical protein [Streptomyces sp. SID8379]
MGPPSSAKPPYASEATRLLCAGTYLDQDYRNRVIEQLHLHEQRIVAPSLGFDAARVLAHALRARRIEVAWAWAVLGLWVVALPLTDYWIVVFLLPSALLALGVWIRGPQKRPPVYRRVFAWYVRWWARLLLALLLLSTVAMVTGDGEDYDSPSYEMRSGLRDGLPDVVSWMIPEGSGSGDALHGWLTLLLLVLIAVCVGAQRSQFARALGDELCEARFANAATDPAESAEGARFQRVMRRIRTEQHAPLIMYHALRPFCGAGEPVDTWTLAVELRPDRSKKQQPLNNRGILEKIRPLLEQLRLPAEFAGTTVRDRLRWLEIDECVFLPAEGLAERADAPYRAEAFEEHRERSVEEGAEKRRHFLRIRVGGWEEELVVTVFVRVHTQGRMLMLEIAPHVLAPVLEPFRDAERTAHQFRHNNPFGKAVWAVARVPGSPARSLVTIGRWVGYGWQVLTGGHSGALPDGPALSVRELGSEGPGSLFQRMDVERYLKSVQDRIAGGVSQALAESGYQTGEFVQKIVNISSGGVNIDRVEDSTFAVGSHASATSGKADDAPAKKGSDDHGSE